MKKNVHPKYGSSEVYCANCGNKFVTGSVVPSIKVDICANCHPFYTGKQVLVDTAGRVERFKKRYQKQK